MDIDEYHDFQGIYGIFYDLDSNFFVDEDGNAITDIFNLITPNELLMFKNKKEYMFVPMVSNPIIGIEVFYPNDEYILSFIDDLG